MLPWYVLANLQAVLCVSSAGQGAIVQTIMPFASAAGQEVCVWTFPVCSAGMNMPLHQISVIPRDVTSSRVSSSGKAKDKDKQVRGEFDWRHQAVFP